MKRLTLILTAAILFHGAVQAQSTASAIFLLIAPGAAAGGRGEAGVADASDAYASYWNPASLAFLPRFELVGQGSNWLPNLADDMKYIFTAIRYNVPEVGTFGGHVIFLDLGTQMRMGENGEELGEFNSNMAAITASFGTKMSPNSAVGFNVKLIHQNLSAYGAGAEGGDGISTNFAFDFAYYRRQFLFSRLDLGLTVSNIGPKIFFIDEEQADPAPTNMKLGIKWHMIETRYNRLALLYDINKLLVASYPGVDHDNDGYIGGFDADGNPSSGGEYSENGRWEQAHTDPWYLALFTSWIDDWRFGGDVDRSGNGIIDSTEVGNRDDATLMDELDTITHNIGIEYWYSTYFAIRIGYIYDYLGKIRNPTFGAGIHYGPYGFDFGYIYGDEGHPLTNTMRFSLNIGF